MTVTIATPLILGSGSPRRAQLIAELGVPFEIIAPGIAEPAHASVDELALAKLAHLADRHPHRVILTADTLVMLDGEQLGKPTNRKHAATMIKACSGQTVTVLSAVCVGNGNSVQERRVASTVQLRELADDEIADYVASGAADDKAGSLALQDKAAHFIHQAARAFHASCENGGCFSNVIGLPMCEVALLLDVAPLPGLCTWPHTR